MQNRNPRRRTPGARLAVCCTCAVVLALAGCGPKEPEEQLQKAATKVDKAEQRVDDARENVTSVKRSLADLRDEMDEAEARLADARKKLRQRQKQLAAERNELHDTASDTAIFRLLQTRLLDEPSLSTAAVSADVIDGRVTLRGEVVDPEQKSKAGEIAANTPGVTEVVNRIDATDGGTSREPAAPPSEQQNSADGQR